VRALSLYLGPAALSGDARRSVLVVGPPGPALDPDGPDVSYDTARSGQGARAPGPASCRQLRILEVSPVGPLMSETGSWREQGVCAQTDPEAFFPEKGGSVRDAKRVCRDCTVTVECLQEALDNREPFGVWGGLSERERRSLLREGVSAQQVADRRASSA
jgi:WhiB family redox-sensing transcriptional regulator